MTEPAPPLAPVRLPPSRRDPLWLLYRALLLVLSPVWGTYAAWRLVLGRSREGRPERFGGGRTLPSPPTPPGVRAWFHGVSVGEVEALAPVIQAFEDAAEGAGVEAQVVVSTTTLTGRARIEALYPRALERRYTPLDLPWTTARALRRIQPSVLVLGESELWPSLLQQTASRAPIVVVNGRISDQTLPRARRLRPLYRWMLRRVALAGVQSQEDANRLVELGLDAGRVRVTGNTKFDRTTPALTPEATARLREELGVGPRVLLVGGSTFPGEDELLLDAFQALRDPSASGTHALSGSGSEGLCLLLAPRHPERGDAVDALVRARGLSLWRRSQGPAPGGASPDVLLLDTVGELATVYGLARVAVVGRSFRMGGGQNPLEPMALGVPVVYGPRMENFRSIARLAEEGGAAIRCESDTDLLPVLRSLLADPDRRRAMAGAGPRILARHRGASERSARLVLQAAREAQPRPTELPPRSGSGGRGALLSGLLALLLLGCSGSPPSNPGSLQSGLPPCPDTPNCAETRDGSGAAETVAPFLLSERFRNATVGERMAELEAVVPELARTRIVAREVGDAPDGDLYLRAESTSRIFRFVDDLELLHRSGSPRLEVRSASRMGRSDLGVNAARVEALRELLQEAGILQP